MNRIAHIVHPVVVPPESDLVVAQPITFESMRVAQSYAKGHVDVSLLGVKYADEEPEWPSGFQHVPDLERSVRDVATFKCDRKLAILDDIVSRLVAASDAEYLIYTNVDIAVQPYFYCTVSQMIDSGLDAFTINRRTISDTFSHVEDLPRLYAEVGEPHPGYDCFVFRRDAYANYQLGLTCVGSNWIGRLMLTNLICGSSRFEEFRDEHLTFHIGDPMPWRTREYEDYAAHNNEQVGLALEHFRSQGMLPESSLIEKFLEDVPRKRTFYQRDGRATHANEPVPELGSFEWPQRLKRHFLKRFPPR
jgi:hypothetical protein